MSIIKFDCDQKYWYRSGRYMIGDPPNENNQWKYSSLEEAVRLNPNVPVENPDTGEVRSVRLDYIGTNHMMVSAITDQEIVETLGDFEQTNIGPDAQEEQYNG